jgi:hypothetical protein
MHRAEPRSRSDEYGACLLIVPNDARQPGSNQVEIGKHLLLLREFLWSVADMKRFNRDNEGPSSDAVVEAALGASGFLTGLSTMEQDHIRQTWRQKRWPDEMKRIEQLESDAEHLARSGQIVVSYPTKCADPSVLATAKASLAAVQKAIASAGAATH